MKIVRSNQARFANCFIHALRYFRLYINFSNAILRTTERELTSHVLLAVFLLSLSLLKFLMTEKLPGGGALRNYDDKSPTLGSLPRSLQLPRVETP